MFDVTKAISKLERLVGWKQPTNFPFELTSALKASTSGRFVTDNDFVKLGFIKDTQENPSITEANFNLLLEDFTRRGIVDLLDKVFDEPDFLDRQLLFKNTNNKVETEPFPTTDGFVGYQLEPPHYRTNYAFEISRVILEFRNFPNDIKLLLYNSAKDTAIKESEVITVTSENQVVELGWILDDTEGLYRGEYFLGYRTADTELQPIKREFESADIASHVRGLYIHPIYSPQPSTNLFDLENIDNVEETWGLNIDLSVYKDYTDLIMQNSRIFSAALQKSIQVNVMESYLSTTRSNRDQRIADDMLRKVLVELNGISTQSYSSQGLKNALESEITNMKQEVRKLIDGYSNRNKVQVVTRS
jgi:hypothetical protein